MNAIYPNWNAPAKVRGFTTTRQGGVSLAPFDSFNLGAHVGDNVQAVAQNRALLVKEFALPQAPIFLNQTHSTRVIQLPFAGDNLDADAVYTNKPNEVCVVMTADCLPVLFCNRQGTEVAAAHAGWRGLCDGMLEATVKCFKSAPEEIIAWLGPAIGPDAFQVGEEVIEQFAAADENARLAFREDPSEAGKYLGNLYQIARQRLNRLGITEITGGDHCTFHEKTQFFSYRRDNQTGRMATVVWVGV